MGMSFITLALSLFIMISLRYVYNIQCINKLEFDSNSDFSKYFEEGELTIANYASDSTDTWFNSDLPSPMRLEKKNYFFICQYEKVDMSDEDTRVQGNVDIDYSRLEYITTEQQSLLFKGQNIHISENTFLNTQLMQIADTARYVYLGMAINNTPSITIVKQIKSINEDCITLPPKYFIGTSNKAMADIRNLSVESFGLNFGVLSTGVLLLSGLSIYFLLKYYNFNNAIIPLQKISVRSLFFYLFAVGVPIYGIIFTII